MKAMVLAAGLGTRLGPLTRDRPKALVTLGGRTLLEITLRRLAAFGVREAVVNAHHFADQIAACLEANAGFGLRVAVSREEVLLDTGGGLLRAAPFLLGGGGPAAPFLIHNVDVLSAIDLAALLRAHRERGALATLAVQDRPTSRPLFFDRRHRLCGRPAPGGGEAPAREGEAPAPLAFTGIHAVSPRLFERMTETGAFSIVAAYLRLAAEGEDIAGFRADGAYWRDLGRPEDLQRAEDDLRAGGIALGP